MSINILLPIVQALSALAMLTAAGFATRYLGRRRRAELDTLRYRLDELLRRIVLLEASRRNVAQVNQCLIDNESLRFRITALEHAYDALDVTTARRPPGKRPAAGDERPETDEPGDRLPGGMSNPIDR